MDPFDDELAGFYMQQQMNQIIKADVEATKASKSVNNTTDVTDAASVNQELRKEEVKRTRKPHHLHKGHDQQLLLSNQQIQALQHQQNEQNPQIS